MAKQESMAVHNRAGGLPEAGCRREDVGNQAGKVVQKPIGEGHICQTEFGLFDR